MLWDMLRNMVRTKLGFRHSGNVSVRLEQAVVSRSLELIREAQDMGRIHFILGRGTQRMLGLFLSMLRSDFWQLFGIIYGARDLNSHSVAC